MLPSPSSPSPSPSAGITSSRHFFIPSPSLSSTHTVPFSVRFGTRRRKRQKNQVVLSGSIGRSSENGTKRRNFKKEKKISVLCPAGNEIHTSFSLPSSAEMEKEEESERRNLADPNGTRSSKKSSTEKKAQGKEDAYAARSSNSSNRVEVALRDVVQSRMPVHLAYRMRGVSKIFKDYPTCYIPDIRQEDNWLLLQRASVRGACCIDPFGWNFHAYSDAEKELFPLSCLPPRASSSNPRWQLKHVVGKWTPHILLHSTPCICSTNGLICIYLRFSRITKPVICICNCLTNNEHYIHLPDNLPHDESNLGTIMDTFFMADKLLMAKAGQDKNYYLLLSRPRGRAVLHGIMVSMDWSSNFNTLILYDSSVKEWKVVKSSDTAIIDAYEIAKCDFFTLKLGWKWSQDNYILGYNASSNIWYKSILPGIRDLLFPSTTVAEEGLREASDFIKRNEKLLMIVWTPQSTKVLQLQPISEQASTLMIESVIPEQLHRHYEPVLASGPSFFAISFIPTTSAVCERQHLVIYDFITQAWFPLHLADDGYQYRPFCTLEPRKSLSFT